MKNTISKSLLEIKNVSSKGLFHLFTANGLIYLVGFASQLFVANLLAPIDMGRIVIMQTYVGLMSLGVGMGFNSSLIKLVSINNDINEKLYLLKMSLIVSILSFAFFYSLLLVLNHFKLISNDNKIILLFPYYALFLLPLGFQSMLLSYYQATKKIVKMARLQFFAKTFSVFFIILFSYYFGLKGFVLAIPLTGIFTIFLLIFGLESSSKSKLLNKFQFDKNQFLKLWKLAKFVLITNILGNILTSSDIYIVNFLVKDRIAVGYYMFALTVVGAFSIIPSTIQQIAFPFFSEKSIKFENWRNSYLKYNKINHLFIFIIGLLGIVFVPLFVRVAFIGKYNPSLNFLIFLILAWMLNALNGMKGTALMGIGKFNLNMKISLISLFISLPITVLLIYYADIEGAVLSKITAGFLSYIISFIIFKSYQNQTSKF